MFGYIVYEGLVWFLTKLEHEYELQLSMADTDGMIDRRTE